MKKNIKILIFLIFSALTLSSYAEEYPSQLPENKTGNQKTKQIKTRRGGEHNSRILKKVIDQSRIQNAEKQEWEFENDSNREFGIGVFSGILTEKAEDSGSTSRGSFGLIGEGRFSRNYRWNASLGTSLFPVWETGSYGFELGIAYSVFQLDLVRVFQDSGRNLIGPRFVISLPLGSQNLSTGVSWKLEAGIGALKVRNPSENQKSTLVPLYIGAEGEFGTLIAGLNWRLGLRLFHTPQAFDFPEFGTLLRVSLFKPM